MKIEWRKDEKNTYLPPQIPVLIHLPSYNFFMISGKGNPNDKAFSEYVGVLYSLAYGIKMSLKKRIDITNNAEYTVYPLEGVWDISEEEKEEFNGKVNKDSLIFDLMIRQPDFVTREFADEILSITKKKKPHVLFDNVKFDRIVEGQCVQMMHVGSYDSEPKSFEIMENFCVNNGLQRLTKQHREIYLSDPRKVTPDKMKTVLRFKVK